MTGQLAFIGDVHGSLPALRGILRAVDELEVNHTVFLGDYINKGPSSAEVLGVILELAATGAATPLAGNHERAMLTALDEGNLSPFLAMGGAATIRSYVGGTVGPDVLKDFRTSFPPEHLEALRSMPEVFEAPGVVATHALRSSDGHRFRISAHVNVGLVPVISRRAALIDTGCGHATGRLTALLWPSRRFVQVDDAGTLL